MIKKKTQHGRGMESERAGRLGGGEWSLRKGGQRRRAPGGPKLGHGCRGDF